MILHTQAHHSSQDTFYLHKNQHPESFCAVDFFAIINIFVTCERNFGYLRLLCHKRLEIIVFNPQLYEPVRSMKLN